MKNTTREKKKKKVRCPNWGLEKVTNKAAKPTEYTQKKNNQQTKEKK